MKYKFSLLKWTCGDVILGIHAHIPTVWYITSPQYHCGDESMGLPYHCLLLSNLLTGSFILLKLLFLKFTMTSSLRWIVVRSLHSFFSTYPLPLILLIIPSFLLVFKIGSVLMVCLLIGSHLIFHFALRQSQSMIPSLHTLLFPVVYPKVPYLAHSFSLSIQLLLARWSQKIPSNIICMLMTPSCTSLSLLQILLYLLKH